jgi:hypothetical protein
MIISSLVAELICFFFSSRLGESLTILPSLGNKYVAY